MLGAGAGAVSWLRTALGAGRRCLCWCCELAAHVVETGCWRWAPGAGAGAGAVSWLRAWWKQVAGAGAGRRVLGGLVL